MLAGTMFLQRLGQRLRERRELRELTQGDVANALQVSPQAVSKWERGENAPDILSLPALAGLLGVTTDWLLGHDAAQRDEFEATVFVSSIQGFTARSETLRPAEIAIWTNGFFRQLTEVVAQHGGVPIKYLGDGFLAFFASQDHSSRAVAAAVAARDIIADPLVVGLTVGSVHLTAIGHAEHARPDLLGSTVNRAFRVSAWAMSNAASRIAISSSVDLALGEQFEVGTPLEVPLKGISELVRIFEVIGRRR